MKEFWNMIQFLFAGIGGWLGYFLGGCDGLLIALLLFVITDYITGVMCAIADKYKSYRYEVQNRSSLNPLNGLPFDYYTLPRFAPFCRFYHIIRNSVIHGKP